MNSSTRAPTSATPKGTPTPAPMAAFFDVEEHFADGVGLVSVGRVRTCWSEWVAVRVAVMVVAGMDPDVAEAVSFRPVEPEVLLLMTKPKGTEKA